MANNMETRNQYNPRTVSHPGKTLLAKIQEIGMSVREFALRSAKPEKTILAVIKGDSSITPDMAVIFENVTQIPAHFWLARQRKYDEYLAKSRMEQKIEASTEWADRFPLKQMEEYGWLQPFSSASSKTKALLQFFAVTSPEAWENYYLNCQLKVAFRISLRSTSEPYAISAWLRQGERQADNITVKGIYSNKILKEKLPAMKTIMVDKPNGWTTLLQELCSECGIKLIFTRSLPKAPINAATRWLYGKYPCIQMSANEKRYDIFWFSFFHEIGHILLHGKKDIFLENIEYDSKEKEKEFEADGFAANMLLPLAQEEEIITNNDFDESTILSFAKKFNTHPSVIVGRLQHRRYISKKQDSELLETIELN